MAQKNFSNKKLNNCIIEQQRDSVFVNQKFSSEIAFTFPLLSLRDCLGYVLSSTFIHRTPLLCTLTIIITFIFNILCTLSCIFTIFHLSCFCYFPPPLLFLDTLKYIYEFVLKFPIFILPFMYASSVLSYNGYIKLFVINNY